MPLTAAQLRLDFIHCEADSSQVPVLATAVVGEDDTLKFWRGLMMCGQPEETSDSSSRCISMVTELHSSSRVQGESEVAA